MGPKAIGLIVKNTKKLGVEAGWNSGFEKLNAYLAEVQKRLLDLCVVI